MGHSTSSGRTATARAENSLEGFRDREVERLTERGINAATAEDIADTNTMREAIKRFESIYSDTRESTPEHTAERLYRELGVDWANSVVGTLVNASEGDGRISGANARWATATNRGAYSPNEAREKRFSTSVHRAHLDQIATAMRRRETTGTIIRANDRRRGGNMSEEEIQRRATLGTMAQAANDRILGRRRSR